MASLPVEILLGVYLGLLTGVFPAFISGLLGFVFRYFTGVTLPGLGVVVLAVAVAGVNGGLLGLIDPTISKSPRLLVALTVVMMLSLYAHSQGDKLGLSLPRRFSLRSIRERTLSADVVELVGGIGTVTVHPVGPVEDLEGYPSLPADLRAAIAADAWEFPADLPLSELETRLAERLRTDYDLPEVAVDIDARGRAQVAAAPPLGTLSRRVPDGHRAVSVSALVPTGMARGESVAVTADGGTVEGTLVSARSDGGGDRTAPAPAPAPTPATGPDAGEDADGTPAPAPVPTTDGGEGRVTVAVPGRDARTLLRADRARVVVRSRGTRREFELVALLRRAGKRIRRVTVAADGPLDGTTLGAAAVRETHGVAVLAVRHAENPVEKPRRGGRLRRNGDRDGERARRWVFSPQGDTALSAGDELFVVGARENLDGFEGVVA